MKNRDFKTLIIFLVLLLNSAGAKSMDSGEQIQYLENWAITHQGIDEIWNITMGKQDIVVAVIDSGIIWDDNVLLNKTRWVNSLELNGETGVDDDKNGFVDDIYGYDFVEKDGDPSRDTNYPLTKTGTIITSIIAASHSNGVMKGVAPDIRIMNLRILNENGYTDYLRGYDAIKYAMDNGANIINIAITYDSTPIFSVVDLLKKAAEEGIQIIINSGNANSDFLNPWAKTESIITVTSGDANGLHSSGRDSEDIDFIAPGDNLRGFDGESIQSIYTGPVWATAMFTGIMALMLSIRDDIPYVREVLEYTATAANTSTRYVNAIDAVNAWIDFEGIDFDNDGMISEFELKYNFDPFNDTDAAEDADGDGLTNLEEFKQGSNPLIAEVKNTSIDPTTSTGFLDYRIPYLILIVPVILPKNRRKK